jgi:hypothetical protein
MKDEKTSVKSMYDISGKDPALSYKLVGPRRKSDYDAMGWVVCKKEEHPNLALVGDRNPESKTGLIEAGPFVLMCTSSEKAQKRKDDNARRVKISEGVVTGPNGNSGTVPVDSPLG